ncbi:hypothetical protein AVEN_148693-1 [Araneus ventricosus]|uniref:Uncharacterized protein n=1 Tax=Araneus ventricosus TaxID=182803 RepID=A0A4Y2FU14_ARAVE|nr:hypothetical protein AVEN_148693-1 [Araneus ventricosus]
MYEKTPSDVTACWGEYLRAALGSKRCVLIDWNDFVVSSAVQARKPVVLNRSTNESVVIVVISDFLTVCVAKSQSAELLHVKSYVVVSGSLERGCQLRCRPRHLTEVQNYEVRPKIALVLLQNGTLKITKLN